MKRSLAAKRTNKSRLGDKSLERIVRIGFPFRTKYRIVKSKCREIGVSGKQGNILYGYMYEKTDVVVFETTLCNRN